jgi:hypothetical protein
MIAIHHFSAEHQLVKLCVGTLMQLPVCNWEYNRPPDAVRCADMAPYLAKPHTHLLQPFYVFYDTKANMYHILDGIHRYTALTMVAAAEEVQQKLVCLHLFTDVSKGVLVDVFENINKTIPVPELYVKVGKHVSSEISVIEDIVADYTRRYKAHFSPNATFCAPNVNREAFVNLLTDLYEIHHIKDAGGLEKILQHTNKVIRDRVEAGLHTRSLPHKFSEKQKEKCRKSGLYLFLYNCELLKQQAF